MPARAGPDDVRVRATPARGAQGERERERERVRARMRARLLTMRGAPAGDTSAAAWTQHSDVSLPEWSRGWT